MKTKYALKVFGLAAFMAGLLVLSASANQLVTPDLRQWAGQAVKEERQLAATIKPRTVAVLYFRNLSNRPALDPLQKGLAVMLISDLAKLDIVTVIERTELQALVEELGFGRSGLVDPDTAPRVGRLLQAEHLISGALTGDAGDGVQIRVDVLEVVAGQAIGQADAKGQPEQIPQMQKRLLDQIVNALQLDLSAAQKIALAAPMSRNPQALMDLFNGIDAGDKGEFEAAADFYGRALARDPDLTLARTSLQQLVALNLAPPPDILTALQNAEEKKRKQRRDLLLKTRERTSFTTRLTPTLPSSRLPHPSAVQPEQLIDDNGDFTNGEDFIDFGDEDF